MIPIQGFKPDDFGRMFSPTPIPMPITTLGAPAPQTGSNSNTLLYIGMGVVVIVAIATAVYIVYKTDEMAYQISLLPNTKAPDKSTPEKNLLSNETPNNHETVSTTNAGNGIVQPIG